MMRDVRPPSGRGKNTANRQPGAPSPWLRSCALRAKGDVGYRTRRHADIRVGELEVGTQDSVLRTQYWPLWYWPLSLPVAPF